MDYVLVDPNEVEQWDDRPIDVRSLSNQAGLTPHDAPLGLRLYCAQPGDQLPLRYHGHTEQVEVFFVLDGELHVETPDGDIIVGREQALFIHPGNPHRAHNPTDATAEVRVLAIGAP